jgi:hypothetical protein
MNLNFKILKPKKKFKKGGIRINPEIYWVSSLGLVFVATVAMVIFGFVLFKKVNTEITITQDDSIKIEKIDKARIDRALEYFTKKTEVSTEVMNSPSPIVDPSR